MTVCATIFNRYYRAPKTPVSSSGPTVLLNAAYLTDTLLNASANPVSNGDPVDSWAMATGGTWTNGLAVLAGATQYPVYIAASGVHTAAGNAALTVATPITIPTDADCVIYVKCVYAAFVFYPLGNSTGSNFIRFGATGAVISGFGGGQANVGASTTAGSYLFRARRVSNVWNFAWTGRAESVADSDSLAGGSVTLDTMLAANSMISFSANGNYVQKLYIYHGSSSPDTAYETANGGTL